MVLVSVWKLSGLISKKSWSFILSMKAKKDKCPTSEQSGRRFSLLGLLGPFSFIQVFLWLNETYPLQGKQSALLDSKVNLIQKNPHGHTQKNFLPIVWASMAQSNWCIKLTTYLSFTYCCFLSFLSSKIISLNINDEYFIFLSANSWGKRPYFIFNIILFKICKIMCSLQFLSTYLTNRHWTWSFDSEGSRTN